jgi:hypothetical protein
MATDDSGSPFFETARAMLNAVDGDSGDEFIDEIEDRFGNTDDLEQTLLGGIAAGEQVMRMRQRSREMADRSQDTTETAIEVRDVETQSGEFKGTRAWIDDPHAQAYPGDDHVLVRTSRNEEIEIPAPQGVDEIQQDTNDTVLELLIVPPTDDDRASTDDDADDTDTEADTDDTPDSDTGSDGDNPEGEDTETTDPETESPEDTADGDE